MEPEAQNRTVTELDHVRLNNLLARSDMAGHPLNDVLDGAEVVAVRLVPPNVVTMNSHVVLEDPGTGRRTALALRYPAEANPGAGDLSVLSPLGTQLLGLRVRDVAAWSTPDGRNQRALVTEVSFQPEAEGQYLT